MFNFEKLAVWQKAIDFSHAIYEVTKKFPRDERFGLTNQLRRASVSVSSNIVEGASRASAADYARFLEIAVGSLFEVVSQLFVAFKEGFIDAASFDQIYKSSEEISRMLSGLRKTILKGIV